MAKKKKGKRQKNKSNNTKTRPTESIAGVQVQKVTTKKRLNTEEVLSCACNKKGFCTVRDDVCKPYSLKCIKNKKSFMPATFSAGYSGKTESTRKVYRSSNAYDPFTAERYGNNAEIRRIIISDEIPTLYVFKGSLNLSRETTIDYYADIKDIRTGRNHVMLVAFNLRNNRYYISETYLKYLHRNKIYINAIINPCNEGTVPLVTFDFNDLSKLAIYGYSVGKHGLSAEDRRMIIRHVIDNKIMKKYEVIELLQGFINLREKREDADFSIAIRDWQSDIIYVNEHYTKTGLQTMSQWKW